MRTIILVLVAGCAAPASSVHTTTPSPSTSAPASLDDAAAVARVHAFFDSVDGRDADAFDGLTGATFALFEEGQIYPKAGFSDSWAERNRAGRPKRTRTCANEQVRRSETAIVYVGDCKEHQPAFEDAKAQDWQGWNTVILVPEEGAWRVALWQWQRSGLAAERARWNEAYRRAAAYTEEPNRLLADTVASAKPGDALVLAMGQGRNAIHLAAKGWRVTGVDISDEGIRIAQKTAAERGLELTTALADIDQYDFGTARWDLVTMIYAGRSPDWIARIKPSIKPGGLFVFEFFRRSKNSSGSGAFIGVEPGELAVAFAGWDIIRDEVVEDIADWGKRKAVLVRFVARKP